MSHITTEDPATLRLPFKEKLSYGIGDLASNILLDIGTLYLLKFYTDVLGLPGTYGGIIFLISKILYCVYRYGYRHYVGFPTQDRSKR
ncbi:putative transporter [Escherichia coli]|nr:putative transporter [Escherichia coli]